MYQIIASDLDETLLNSNKEVSEIDQIAIQKALAKGVKFVLASGRGFTSFTKTLKQCGLEQKEGQYCLSFNGAAVVENKNFRLLYTNPLDFDSACFLYQKGVEYGVCMHFYTKKYAYRYKVDEGDIAYMKGRMELIEYEQEDINSFKEEPIFKLIYASDDIAYLQKIETELKPYTTNLDVSYSSGRYLEFNQKGANKGEGLIQLAKYLNVDIKDTIAIGDNINDLPMLKVAGLSIGVANSNAAILPYCKYVTKADNNHGAISEVIERFILKED